MAELGYVDGKNFALEFIELTQPNQFVEAFKELVQRKVDVLLAYGAEASLNSAMAASKTTPIVMVAIDLKLNHSRWLFLYQHFLIHQDFLKKENDPALKETGWEEKV